MLRHLGILFLFLALFSSSAFSAEVIKVKGKSALIDLKGEPAQAGDVFFALSSDGKRRGKITISKVKGDKAIGKIVKGRAEAGMSLEFKPAKATAVAEEDSGSAEAASEDGHKMYWGILLGISQTSMDAQVNSFSDSSVVVGTTAMSGMSFSAKGLFDYELFHKVWFRGTTGLEGVDVSGNSICGSGNTGACNAQIWYLSFDFLGRYVFTEHSSKMRPWAGGGVEMLFPMSKKASALNTKTITTTSVLAVAGGLDWQISPKYYVPISLEYGLFPSSSEVKAHWIAVRAGLVWPW